MIVVRPTWPLSFTMMLFGVILGFYVRGCVPDPAGEVERGVSGYRPGVTERIIERPVYDTVTQVVYRDRIRLVQSRATSVSTIRHDTLIQTPDGSMVHPFRARLDTVVGTDTVKILFDYPPPVFALVDVRHAPDTVRSVLERTGLDRVFTVRRGFWETTGRAGAKGVFLGGAMWFINDRTRPGSPAQGMNVLESIGVGAALVIVADTVDYILDH